MPALQLDRFIFPLFSAVREPEIVRIQRFLGCGFWLDQHGHFATCKHVLEGATEGQVPVIGKLAGPNQNYFFHVKGSALHPQFDVAVGRAGASAVGGVLPQYTGSLGLGLEVQAFGCTDSGKQGGNYQVDPRLLRGHVSRFSHEAFGLPSPSLLEVSFGSPSGFSGAPLLVEGEVVGIMYSNLDSRLQAYSIQETIEGKSEYREVAYRIYEYGIAHRLADLQQFFSECGVGTDGGV
jgi:hypothetical protein